MDFLFYTWPWYVSGFLIGSIMIVLILLGKSFGMSSNLRSICSISGAGNFSDFFRYDKVKHGWNLVVVLGAMLGGFVAVNYMHHETNIELNPDTIKVLAKYGFDEPKGQIAPNELFGMNLFQSPKAIFILIIGGFLIGFGSRYAGGCTSGHAIQGLSNLQLPSLKAVIGFFIGGLIMIHLLYPLIF